MNEIFKKLQDCLKSVREITDFEPEVALVLGSGLGDFANGIEVECEIDYHDIKGFPVSTVPGHAGKFIFGKLGDVKIVCMKGRVHFYEGYPISDVVLPARLMYMLGAKILFLTNASGSTNLDIPAGSLMLIKDHVSIFAPNPLIGANIDELGTRFPDMSSVYDEKLCEIIKASANNLGIDIKEGIYCQLTGPSFESPAEIQLLKHLGVDAVGMSTVVEAIAANHCGMRICGISCACNMAAGISPNPLTHDEVQEAAAEAAPKFKKLLTDAIINFKAEL